MGIENIELAHVDVSTVKACYSLEISAYLKDLRNLVALRIECVLSPRWKLPKTYLIEWITLDINLPMELFLCIEQPTEQCKILTNQLKNVLEEGFKTTSTGRNIIIEVALAFSRDVLKPSVWCLMKMGFHLVEPRHQGLAPT